MCSTSMEIISTDMDEKLSFTPRENVINFLNFVAWLNYLIFHFLFTYSPPPTHENEINVIISQKLTFKEF